MAGMEGAVRHLLLNLDMTIKVMDVKEGDLSTLHAHINKNLESITIYRNDQFLISMWIDEDGQMKRLLPNSLASSIRGVFKLQTRPLLGPAILWAADPAGDTIDLPQKWIDLVQAIRKVL